MNNYLIAALSGCLLMGMASLPLAVFAHGGEDHSHDDAPPAPIIAPNNSGIRWELQSPDVELLGALHDGKLTLYASHFRDNTPIPNANIELESKGQKLLLQTDANGIGETEAAWLQQADKRELLATVQAKGVNDLLVGKLAFSNGTAQATRLTDGSVFMPQASQQILGLHTTTSKPQTVAQSVTLNGVVVTDPNASAVIQPPLSGRLLAPQNGFPSIGSRVKKGQILAILEPAASNTDKGDQQDKIAEVRSELALAEKNAARLTSIAGVIPQMEVDAARNTADTLNARLKALQSHLAQQPQPLLAPLSGIISSAKVALGQQANAGDVLFEIIDPAQLQVEALAYDATVAAQITGATTTLNGQTLTLDFIGSSQQLRNQALPLRFTVLPPSPLAGEGLGMGGASILTVGQPLKLAVQTRTSIQGTPLPASSVVNNNQQQPTVWVKTAAERFTPHTVKLQTLDADTVIITEGLPNSSIRAVTNSAVLLSQVR
ncbi:efflux RND transporter periplasmic adaptor subunit [Thiothrix subterranea]|uniref:HlyD family efflux transporter periplasmic adaptor subunit n=1 Tax=Thiothrix subterranea TaxID=2735563 RepID=A0AA51R2Y7_9GAMM|nr:HlyD family efflux transporter periplasmic adaptor subunit [Thiothrix subterranea]MDQ5769368.1 HlyD family efflux transporter periplasmic adaptor subunit [Thiothrix subterranea]WML85010.1 HlyD family efflux transporter periplasmic adaptor subunit [Thiothrix subterranea]